jgi:hypothetical protein
LKRFEDAREMFLTQGWKDLVETLQEHHDSITIDRVNTIEDLHHQKGRLDILRLIISYEDQVRHEEAEQEQN